MKSCDGCGSLNTGVVDSREADTYVRRRRKCNNCGSRWSTYEVTEEVYKTLTNSARAIARLDQAQREILSAVDVLRDTFPSTEEEQRAAKQFTSPNPRAKRNKKDIERPTFARSVA